MVDTIYFTDSKKALWKLTTDHATSSYGQPVLVGPDGQAYGPKDSVVTYYGDSMTADQFIDSCLFLVDLDQQGGELVKRWYRLNQSV